MRRPMLLALGLALALCGAACGGSDESPGGGATTLPTGGLTSSPTGAGTAETTVNVTLREYSVIPAQASAPPNTVTFVAKNDGPKKTHELAVVKTDLEPGAIPKNADGTANENAPGVELIGRIAEFEFGKTAERTFQLEAGRYVLFCNVLDEDEAPALRAHYGLGMFASFTVG